MSQNDIEVRVGAEVGPLERGMDQGAKSVRDGARNMEDSLRSASSGMAAAAEQLQQRLAGLFSLGAIFSFVKSTQEAVTEAEAAFRGLEAVANYSGVGISRAMEEAGKLAADGLMTTAEASKGLQNLLSRGYDLDQAVATLNRLKDAAAFNRQASLQMGEAVVTATEGLKNENSVLVDNAGVTKNVAKMWEEYAKQHGISTQEMTQAQKIQAEYNGIMAETEAQVGNAAKAMDGMQGKQAQLNKSWQDMKVTVGEALVPAFAKIAEWGKWVIDNVFVPMVKAVKIVGAAFGAVAVDIGNVWNAVTSFNFSGLGAKFEANARQFKETVDEIVFAQAGSSFTPGEDNGKRRQPDAATPGKTGSKSGRDGRFQAWKSELEAMQEAESNFFGNSLEMEERFWKEKLAKVTGNGKADVRLRQQIGHELFGIHKRQAQEQRQLDDQAIGFAKEKGMAEVEAAREALEQKLALGKVGADQYTAELVALADREFQINQDALNDKLALYGQDKVARQKLLDELAMLEIDHGNRIAKIYADSELKKAQVSNSMAQDRAAFGQRMATLEVDAQAQAAQHLYDMGLISHQQLLEEQINFLNRKLELEQEYLNARLAMLGPDDPVEAARIKQELLEVERQYQIQRQGILNQIELESGMSQKAMLDGIEQSMSSSIQRLLTLQTNFAGAIRSLFQGVANSIASEMAKMAAKWIMEQIGLRAAAKATALGEIMTNAAKAGSGGVASMAAAPWPISMGAPAFGAAMSAAAMAFAPMASASGGYDIPAGINPITQLHAREMVLPAHLADAVRGMAAGGGEGAGTRIVNVIDPSMAADYLNSAAGEKTFLNVLRSNAAAVKQILT